MANRKLNQFRFSFEPAIVDIYLKATIGSSGAITLDSAMSRGIVSITKETTAGQYTILLQDSYAKFMGITHSVLNSTGISAAPNMGIISEAVATLAAPTIVVQFSVGGAAGNLASGDVVRMQISVKNSSA